MLALQQTTFKWFQMNVFEHFTCLKYRGTKLSVVRVRGLMFTSSCPWFSTWSMMENMYLHVLPASGGFSEGPPPPPSLIYVPALIFEKGYSRVTERRKRLPRHGGQHVAITLVPRCRVSGAVSRAQAKVNRIFQWMKRPRLFSVACCVKFMSDFPTPGLREISFI